MKNNKPVISIIMAATLYMLSSQSVTAQTEVTGNTLNIYRDTANTVMPNSGSAAFGRNNTVPVSLAYAFGERNTIGQYAVGSFVSGGSNTVTFSNAVCLGRFNSVSSSGGLAIGQYLQPAGTFQTFVIGEGLASDAMLGTTNDHCLLVGFQSTRPTLTVTRSYGNSLAGGVTDRTGKVAIGDVWPQAKLHLRSDEGEEAGLILEPKQPSNDGAFIQLWDEAHRIEVAHDGAMRIAAGDTPLDIDASSLTLHGKVGVNTTNDTDGYALAVDGGIVTTEVHIQPSDEWPDYVFSDGYDLMPLGELKRFVETHRHLPGIPSGQRVEQDGYDMGAMQSALLRKVEELTLHTIRQQEEIEALKKTVEDLMHREDEP